MAGLARQELVPCHPLQDLTVIYVDTPLAPTVTTHALTPLVPFLDETRTPGIPFRKRSNDPRAFELYETQPQSGETRDSRLIRD